MSSQENTDKEKDQGFLSSEARRIIEAAKRQDQDAGFIPKPSPKNGRW